MDDQSARGQSKSVRQIASAAGIMGAATFLSRTLGFVRDMAFAWLVGAGMVADAFFAAFRIPSTLRALLGEGALSAAFVPAFTRTASRDGRGAAWAMASKVMGTLLVVLTLVTAAGVLLAPWIAQVIAFGFGSVPGKLELTATLLQIMFPYILVVGLAALFMAILNALGHFLTPALSPTVLNLAIIAAALVVAPRVSVPVIPIAIAVVLGGIGQLAIQIPAAVSLGWQPAIQVAPRDPAFYAVGSAIVLTLLGAGLVASFFHLGRPEQAWRAATRWRTSCLSREVLALPAVMALVGSYGLDHWLGATGTLFTVAGTYPVDATLILGAVGTVATLVLFVCTAMIYAAVRFLEEWHTPWTVLNYLLLGATLGFTLAAAFSAWTGVELVGYYGTWAVSAP